MLNQEMRTVTLSRSDMVRVAQSLTHMVWEFREEIENPNTTEARRRAAQSSMEMWKRIRDEVDRQLNEQDPEEFRR